MKNISKPMPKTFIRMDSARITLARADLSHQKRIRQDGIEKNLNNGQLNFTASKENDSRRLHGPDTFPLDETLETIEREFPVSAYDDVMIAFVRSLGLDAYAPPVSSLRSSLAICNTHLQNLKKREACEIVLWGRALPETLEEVSFFEQEKEHAIRGSS